MTSITTEQVKDLRDETGISVMMCKKALEEAGGDREQALRILREKGAALSAKKAGRALEAGVVSAYVHNTKEVGTMVVLSSETDFVAKNDAFTALAYDIAMHAAAMNPETIDELLEQEFIKEPGMTVRGLIESAVAKFGENIAVSDFVRLSVK